MYTSPQGYIAVYSGVHWNVSRESSCTSKGQATIIKERIALMWKLAVCWFYTDPGQNWLWDWVSYFWVANLFIINFCQRQGSHKRQSLYRVLPHKNYIQYTNYTYTQDQTNKQLQKQNIHTNENLSYSELKTKMF